MPNELHLQQSKSMFWSYGTPCNVWTPQAADSEEAAATESFFFSLLLLQCPMLHIPDNFTTQHCAEQRGNDIFTGVHMNKCLLQCIIAFVRLQHGNLVYHCINYLYILITAHT